MRKSSILGVLGLIAVIGLAGQALALPIGPSAGIGIKGGLNLAKASDLEALASGTEFSNDVKTGFAGGAFARFAFGPLNAQIEGLYSVKGNKGTALVGGTEWETKLAYFEIPLLLKMELPLPALAPYLYVGPSLGFLLKGEAKNTAVSDEWIDVKDDMKSTEWSLALGGGVRMLKFHADVRYTMGLTELLEEDTAGSVLSDTKNRCVSFYLGYEMLSF